MHIMFVGAVGAGKTFNAIAFAEKCPGQKLFANMDVAIPGRELVRWTDFEAVKDATCGTLLIDEASMFFDAREFAKMSSTAKDLLKEHRKHHLRIITTTQDVSFIDKIFRILCDEVRVCHKLSLPFIGWIWPDCVRPAITCRHCGFVRLDDGKGDHHAWWGRWFGFGTIYYWKVYPPAILGEQEDASGAELDRKEIPAISWGYQFFSMRVAKMYDTSARVSTDAHENRLHLKQARGKI